MKDSFRNLSQDKVERVENKNISLKQKKINQTSLAVLPNSLPEDLLTKDMKDVNSIQIFFLTLLHLGLMGMIFSTCQGKEKLLNVANIHFNKDTSVVSIQPLTLLSYKRRL